MADLEYEDNIDLNIENSLEKFFAGREVIHNLEGVVATLTYVSEAEEEKGNTAAAAILDKLRKDLEDDLEKLLGYGIIELEMPVEPEENAER